MVLKGHKYYFVHSFNISVLNFPNIVLLLYTFVDLIKMEKYIQIIRREVELKKTRLSTDGNQLKKFSDIIHLEILLK